MDGVVTEVLAEEGQSYRAGTLLVAMDSRLAAGQVAEKEARLSALRSSLDQFRLNANALSPARPGALEARSVSQGMKVAEDMIQEATAALEIAKLLLSRHKTFAPQEGVVGKLFVKPGDSVVEGQRILLHFDPRTVRVEARVSERNLALFEVGKNVSVSLDASGGAKFPGTIKVVGALAQSASSEWPQQPEQGSFVRVAQKVPVQIAIATSDERLIPGTLAKVIMDRQ
jgi:membrane fusion protein (multidrug efflux system)